MWGGQAQRSGRRGDKRKGRGEVVEKSENQQVGPTYPLKKKKSKNNCKMSPPFRLRNQGWGDTYVHIYIYLFIDLFIMLCYVKLYHIILYYIILHYITLYYIILYYIVLYHIILYYMIWYHIILYYTMLNGVILWFVILYYISFCFIMSYIENMINNKQINK